MNTLIKLSGLRFSNTGLEPVFEFSGDVFQVSHSTGTSGSSSFSFSTPVVRSHFSSWVSTRSTGLFLTMERSFTTSFTQSVRFVVFFTK